MDLQLNVKMNSRLFVKDPAESALGKSIVEKSITLIYELGFEDFTFKKLAGAVGTTEASIYRYFENKHRLLTYILAWFWACLEYQLVYHTNNLPGSREKIHTVIRLVMFTLEDDFVFQSVDREKLFQVAITEASKSYLTKHVTEDNKDHLFKPYKDLCARIAAIFSEYNPAYKYPRSLASTLIEIAHYQFFFKNNLPSLTDFANDAGNSGIQDYLEHLVFAALDAKD